MYTNVYMPFVVWTNTDALDTKLLLFNVALTIKTMNHQYIDYNGDESSLSRFPYDIFHSFFRIKTLNTKFARNPLELDMNDDLDLSFGSALFALISYVTYVNPLDDTANMLWD
eukprot:42455_1